MNYWSINSILHPSTTLSELTGFTTNMSAPAKRVAERAKAGGGGAAAPAPRVSTQPTPTTTSKAQPKPKPKPPSEEMLLKWKQSDARLFGKALRGTPYALIGGFAHQLLGCKTLCSGFHVFVPSGHSAQVCDKLAADSSGMFERSGPSNRTMTLNQNGLITIVYICEPQAVHQAFPNTDDGFVTLFSARVLKPALLLNMAIYTWMKHHTAGTENWKKKGANADIIFLVDYIARQEREDMQHATPDFLKAFFAANENQEPVFFSIGLKRPAVKASGSGSGSTDTVAAQGQGGRNN